MNNKLALFQSRLKEDAIDCAVIGPTTNMHYLLGGAPHPDERLCILVITQDTAEIIVPALNVDSVRAFTDIEMLTWEDAAGPSAALARSALGKTKFSSLAVDGAMRADFLLAVRETAAPTEMVSADPVIGKLRIVKSPDELQALRDAAAQADRAMQAAVEACGPGTTEAEIAWAAESAFRIDGAQTVEFTLVAAGENGASPHHHSGIRKLKPGDGIVIDIGASLNGYKSDITRMVYLGDPSDKFLEAYEIVRKANEFGRNAVRPGADAAFVDSAARKIIADGGYGEHFIHRTGHGIGLDIHEEPYIQQGNDLPLRQGMTFSIEPGVYFHGEFGIRIEDIVAVSSEGVETLTGFDHTLVVK